MKNDYIIEDNYAYIYVNYKDQSYKTKVTLQGLEKAKQISGMWYAYKNEGQKLYVKATQKTENKYTTVYLHRLLLNAKKDQEVDHKDRDTLNNVEFNLRIVTPTQNKLNTGMYKSNKTGVRGLSWFEQRKVWVVQFKAGDYKFRKDFKNFAAAVYTAKWILLNILKSHKI